MNKSVKRWGSLALSAVMGFSVVGSNVGVLAMADSNYLDPEKDAVVFSTAALDGNFNPFFATSGTDTTIIAQTQIGMMTTDVDGNLAYGQDEPTVVLDFKETMFNANGQPTQNGAEASKEAGGSTEYEFIIKKGIKFSDGSDLTIEDVLFNLYVYLDPVYSGSATIYSTDIVGLQAYRTQQQDASEEGTDSQYFYGLAEERVQKIAEYFDPDNDSITWEEVKDDVKLVAKLFREEMESDWTASQGTQESYKEEYRFTKDWEIYYWNAGLINKQQIMDPEKLSEVDWKDENGKYYTTLDPSPEGDDLTELDDEMKAALNDSALISEYMSKYDCTEELAKSYIERDTAINTVYTNFFGENTDDFATDSGLNKEYISMMILYYHATASTLRDEFAAEAKTEYYADMRNEDGTLRVPTVSGITTSQTRKDFSGKDLGADYDTLKIKINGVDPKAKWNFAFTVAPMNYYSTNSYTVSYDANGDGEVGDTINPIEKAHESDQYFGVEFADKNFFDQVLNHVDKTGLPVGAGVYKATDDKGNTNVKRGDFYKNNFVYFQRNDYFHTVGTGLSNAKIKYMNYTVVSSNQILNALEGGRIHFGEPNADKFNDAEVKTIATLDSRTYWTNGYGYVGVNPKYVPDIEVRRAIMKAMDTAQIVKNYYTEQLAKTIYRPMSMESWAYPQGVKEYDKIAYQYDASKYNSKKEEIQALVESAHDNGGNRWTLAADGKYYNESGDALKFTFTIAGGETDHPAYKMFQDAATLLNDCGFDITVITSPNALKSLATGALEVWAAAWSSTIDPDMYQVYHKDSTATSVKNWGYPTILNDSTGQFVEEQDIINALSLKIEAGRATINQDERAGIYHEALNMVMDLAVELPTYQRKDLVVWNKTVIDSSTLNLSPSSTAGLVDRIWEINFVNENSGKTPANNNGLVIGIVIGAVVVLGGAGAFVFLKLRKKPQTYVLDESAEETTEEKTESDSETDNN